MRRKHFAHSFNRFRQGMTELLVAKMDAHSIHDMFPELFAAFFMDGFVANYSKFVSSRGNENQDGVVPEGLVHSETFKLSLRSDDRIRI